MNDRPTSPVQLSAREWLVAVFLIAATLTMQLWPMLSKPGTPDFVGPGDAWRSFGPQAFYMDDRIHHGEFPLWNPLNWCGRPFAVDPTATPFYPPHLLRSIMTWHPTPMNAHVGMMIVMWFHALLAGLGVYRLCRDYRLSPGAAYVGVFCFLFGAPYVFALHRHYFYVLAAAWMPILVLWLKRALDSGTLRDRVLNTLLLGLSFGMAMLVASVLQPVLYMSIVLVGFWALYRISALPGSPRKEWFPQLLRDGAIGIAAAALALLIALVGLLPTFEIAGMSPRRGGDDVSYSGDNPVTHTVGEVIRVLVTYSTDAQYQYLGTAGAVAVLLAICAVLFARKRDILPYLVPAYILFDCSLGKPMPFASLLTAIAPYELGPAERSMLVGAFPLAMLAAFGADAAALPVGAGRRSILFFSGAGVLGILAWQLVSFDYLGLPKWVWAVPAVALVLLVLGRGLSARGTWLAIAMAVLVLTETLAWTVHFLPFHLNDNQRIASVEGWDRDRPFWPGNRRVYDPMPNVAMYDLQGTVTGYTPLYTKGMYQTLCSPDTATKYQRQLVREVYTDNQRAQLFLKRPFWLARQYVHGALPPKDALFPPASTVYLPDADGLSVPRVEAGAVEPHAVSAAGTTERIIRKFQFERIVPVVHDFGEKKSIYYHLSVPLHKSMQQSSMLLRVRSNGKLRLDVTIKEIVAGEPQEANYLYAYTFDSLDWEESVLEYPLPDFETFQLGFSVTANDSAGEIEFTYADLCTDTSDEDSLIKIVRRMANSVTVDCNTLPAPRILVFNDTFYRGWHAYIDGAEVPVLRANDTFKAVEVPAGTHRVEFVFRPVRVYVGAIVSITGFGVALAGLALLWRGRILAS